MEAHITFDDTNHSAEHTDAGVPEDLTDDTCRDRLPVDEVDGYGDDYDPDNKPCADDEHDYCPVEQPDALEMPHLEDHADSTFYLSTTHGSNHNNTPITSSLSGNPTPELDVSSIAAVYKDPVLLIMFRKLDDHFRAQDSRGKLVSQYIKLTLAKFAVVRNVKETETEFPELMIAMETLEFDRENNTITETDGPAQKVIKAGRALRNVYQRVDRAAKRALKLIVTDTGAEVPEVYNQNKEADLCGVWYAIESDRHYQGRKLMIPRFLSETRVVLITHLHLLGGTPAHYKIVERMLKNTSYQQLINLLPGLLSYSRCEQAARLGYSTKMPTTGRWRYQFSPSLDALDPECWTELCEENYQQMRERKQVVFLIHAADQAIPSGIAAKALSRPSDWNTGAGSVTRMPASDLPPPCFLPGPLGGAAMAPVAPTLAPGLPREITLPSHPARKRSNPHEGQQESKKAKTDE